MAVLNDTIIHGDLYLKKKSKLLYGPNKNVALSFSMAGSSISSLTVGNSNDLYVNIKGLGITGTANNIKFYPKDLLLIASGKFQVGSNTSIVHSSFFGDVSVYGKLISNTELDSYGKTRIYGTLIVAKNQSSIFGENCFDSSAITGGNTELQTQVRTYIYDNDISGVFVDNNLFAGNTYFHNPAYPDASFFTYIDRAKILKQLQNYRKAFFYSTTIFGKEKSGDADAETIIKDKLSIIASECTSSGLRYGIEYRGTINFNDRFMLNSRTSTTNSNVYMAVINTMKVLKEDTCMNLYLSGDSYVDMKGITLADNPKTNMRLSANCRSLFIQDYRPYNYSLNQTTGRFVESDYKQTTIAIEVDDEFGNMPSNKSHITNSSQIKNTSNDFAYFGVDANALIISGNTIYNPYYCNFIITNMSGNTVTEFEAPIINLGKHTGENNVTGCAETNRQSATRGIHRVNRQIIKINGRLVGNFKGLYGEQPPDFFYNYKYQDGFNYQMHVGVGMPDTAFSNKYGSDIKKYNIQPVMGDGVSAGGSSQMRYPTMVPPVAGQIYFQTID